MASSVFFF